MEILIGISTVIVWDAKHLVGVLKNLRDTPLEFSLKLFLEISSEYVQEFNGQMLLTFNEKFPHNFLDFFGSFV